MAEGAGAQDKAQGSRRPMISRSYLEAGRRRRFAAAAAELADEFGLREVSVKTLCHMTQSSRGTFYELFRDAEDCMRLAAADGFELLFAETLAALDAPASR